MGLLWVFLILLPLAILGFITIYKKIPLKRFNELNAKEQCIRASVLALITGAIYGVTEGIQFYRANAADGFPLIVLGSSIVVTLIIFAIVSGLFLAFIRGIHFVIRFKTGRKILKVGTKILFWGINIATVGGTAYLFIHNFRHGINTGWLVPALANHNDMLYKWNTIGETFGMLLLFPILALNEYHWLITIPVFYILYIIETVNRKKRKGGL